MKTHPNPCSTPSPYTCPFFPLWRILNKIINPWETLRIRVINKIKRFLNTSRRLKCRSCYSLMIMLLYWSVPGSHAVWRPPSVESGIKHLLMTEGDHHQVCPPLPLVPEGRHLQSPQGLLVFEVLCCGGKSFCPARYPGDRSAEGSKNRPEDVTLQSKEHLSFGLQYFAP